MSSADWDELQRLADEQQGEQRASVAQVVRGIVYYAWYSWPQYRTEIKRSLRWLAI